MNVHLRPRPDDDHREEQQQRARAEGIRVAGAVGNLGNHNERHDRSEIDREVEEGEVRCHPKGVHSSGIRAFFLCGYY